jgi:predicted GTPase
MERFNIGDVISDDYTNYVVLRSDLCENGYYDSILIVKETKLKEFIRTQNKDLTKRIYASEDIYYDYYVVEKSKYKIKTIYTLE